jgi:hypothetical protein
MFNTPFTFLKATAAGGDADATAYLAAVVAAGGTVDATITTATNTLFTSLKSAGLYTKVKAMYPIVGGVAAAHAVEGKNPGGPFNLIFNGTFTHGASGFTGIGGTPYAETNYIPLTQHPGGTMTMGMFTNTNGANFSDYYMMGAFSASNRFLGWDYNEVSTGAIDFTGKYLNNTTTTTIDVGTTANSLGMVQIGGNGTTKTFTHNLNGVDSSASAAQDGSTLPAVEIYLSSLNLSGSPYHSQGSRAAFAYMSDYLTLSEMNNIAAINNAFQTALGRNTY